MTWWIASIPFWVIAGVVTFVGCGSATVGLSSSIYGRGKSAGRLKESRYVYLLVGLGYLGAGCCARFLAAKVVSLG